MKIYKYTFSTPLCGAICCEEVLSDTDGQHFLSPEAMAHMYTKHGDRLSMFLSKYAEDLSEHVPAGIKEFVLQANFGDYGMRDSALCLYTHIVTTQRLSDKQMEEICDWIEGQMSDGWGESLEQREWYKETVHRAYTVFDEDDLEFVEDGELCSAHYHVVPYDPDYVDVHLYDYEEEHVDGPEPVIYGSTCSLLEDDGYEVRTVYQSMDADDVVTCLKNSGAIGSEELATWMLNHGTFGCAVKYYFVSVNHGLSTKILPMFGALDMDAHKARLFTFDPQNGFTEMEEYTQEEFTNFYLRLLDK